VDARKFTSCLPAAGQPSELALVMESIPLRCGRPGDLIAFTKPGSSAIGVMGVDGRGERILTEGFQNEGPTFAPNGLVLMFLRDAGGNTRPSLYTIDITGRNETKGADAKLCIRPGVVAIVGVKCVHHTAMRPRGALLSHASGANVISLAMAVLCFREHFRPYPVSASDQA
jgi:hypothetical protein